MQSIYRETTSTALLEGLHDVENHAAWREFDERFRPMLVNFCARLGLTGEDAADVAQETILHFVRDYRAGKYDRTRGRLGPWLMGIARHRLSDAFTKKAARREARGESAMVMLPDESELGALWESECRRAVLENAMQEMTQSSRVSPLTLEAFRLHVVDELSVEDVASRLGTTPRMVYLAKHRCLRRLRGFVDMMSERYGLV